MLVQYTVKMGKNIDREHLFVCDKVTCLVPRTASLHIYEHFPSPIGVTSQNATSVTNMSHGVALGGVVEGFSNLFPGMIYVTDTQGQILPSGLYFGHLNVDDYITYTNPSTNDVTIINADATIGHAISSDKIAISFN
jgi:hypothetical protein